MRCQMMRVISSPSISTTGFFTLIFAIADEPLRARMCEGSERNAFGHRPYGAAARILQGQNICVLNCARGEGAPLCAVDGVRRAPAALAGTRSWEHTRKDTLVGIWAVGTTECRHGARSEVLTAAAAARFGRRCSNRFWSAGRYCATS